MARRAVSAAFFAFSAAFAQGSAPVHAAPGVPCGFYGINPGAPVSQGEVLLDPAYADRLAASGAGAVRIDFRLDGAAAWDAEQLSRYEAIVDAALAAGLEPLGLIAYEAVPAGQESWNDDPDGDGYNDYVAAFAATAQVLMGHFAGSVRRWEVWNEPNCWSNPDYATDPQNAGCSYLLPRVFAAMMTEVYLRNEPLLQAGALSLVSGGLFAHDIGGASSPATDYLGELYAQEGAWDALEVNAGRRYPWDSLGYHLYVDQEALTDGALLTAYLDAVRDLSGQRGDEAPFAVTEIGWSTLSLTEEVQAENLSVAFNLLSAREDVAGAYWFSYRDAPADDLFFGLASETDVPKLALAALQGAAEGCVRVPSETDGGGSGGAGPGSSGVGMGGPGPAGGGTAPPLGGPAREDSCSCTAAGAGGRQREAASLLLLSGAALALRLAAPRRRRSRR